MMLVYCVDSHMHPSQLTKELECKNNVKSILVESDVSLQNTGGRFLLVLLSLSGLYAILSDSNWHHFFFNRSHCNILSWDNKVPVESTRHISYNSDCYIGSIAVAVSCFRKCSDFSSFVYKVSHSVLALFLISIWVHEANKWVHEANKTNETRCCTT